MMIPQKIKELLDDSNVMSNKLLKVAELAYDIADISLIAYYFLKTLSQNWKTNKKITFINSII